MKIDDLQVPIRRPENITAAYLADWMSRSTEYYQGPLLRHAKVLDHAHRMAVGEKPKSLLYFPDAQAREIIMSSMLYYAILKRWEESRIVYDVDMTTADSLLDTATDEEIPVSILRQVSHPSPMFVWREGIPYVSPDGYRAVLRAMYVTGHTESRGLTDIHDPDTENLLIMFVCDIEEDSEVVTVDTVRIHVPLNEQSLTLDKLVDDLEINFAWQGMIRSGNHEANRRYIRDLLSIGLPHVFHACSSNADIGDPVPHRTIAKGKNKGKPTKDSIQNYPFGFRIGQSLRESSYSRPSRAGGTGSGGSRAPHWRRWHMHTYLYGKGRTIRKLKSMPPIFVRGSSRKKLDGTVIKLD
ncbi:hypothetical protein [Rhodococcus qingshengii]|uniref:hypothetical protein n=1 Tax=Rhodococcus qingshengii TaxID=334542 RepID=UPI0035E0D27E